MVLEKTLENPLDYKEIKTVNFKEINPGYFLEGLMLKLQYFGHLMQTADSLEKTMRLGKIESSQVVLVVKNLPANAGDAVKSLGQEDSWE